MIKIFFRKILPYDPTFGGKYSRYEGYSRITMQKDSPGIMEDRNLDLKGNLLEPIFSSSLKRGEESAKKYAVQLGKKKIKSLHELNEIKFDLKKLLTEEEFKKYGSDLVRERFLQAFIDDELGERRDEIFARIQKLILFFQGLENGNYLVVSHSFFMKIFEVYSKDKRLLENPQILVNYLNPKKRTYENARGFDIKLPNS